MLTPILSGLAAALVVYLLARGVRPDAQLREGRQWVEYGTGYRVLSAALFPLSAFVTYAALHSSLDQRVLALLIAGLFWLGTVYLAYEIFFVQLSYDDQFIYHQSPLRGRRQIPWDAVIGIDYSRVVQAFMVQTDGHGMISVSPMADGSQALIERVSAWVDHDQRSS